MCKLDFNIDKTIDLIYVDLFCGAGGTSTGVESATINGKRCAKVIACVNHDKNAIASHAANHPDALHFTEDIRTLDLTELLAHVALMRLRYPNAKLVLWASLECTNFSKAKGGQARNADSRTLALHLFRYIEALSPDLIQIENVEEFMAWGELDANGKPKSKTAGTDYVRWIKQVCSYGYEFDFRILNSADFGAYTSRKRFFAQFAASGVDIVWPSPTHCKGGSTALFTNIKKWLPVRDVLDLLDEGKSIFNRKKPLSPKTLEVIIAGIDKAIAEGENCFLFKYYGNGNNLNSLSSPAGTITTKDHFAKVQLIFNQYKNGNVSNINSVFGSLTTIPKQNLLTFIFNPAYGGSVINIDRPCPTVVARQDKAPLSLLIAKMDEHGLVDIRKRMLKIDELKPIMGFPRDYILIGTQSQQKKYIGNAVEVNMAKAICKSTAIAIRKSHNQLTT